MKLTDVVPNLTDFILNNTEKFPDEINKIILFGSYAKNEQRVSSDVDIALVADETWETLPRCSVRDVFDNFDDNVEISLFFTTSVKIEAAKNVFDANFFIKKEGVLLWER